MTLKHVLKYFSKTEVQEDKTHSTPPLKREGVSVLCAEHTDKNLFSYLPIHLFTSKKVAFTLAEVLITLAIIGVVAAITLPTVINNVNERVNSSRQANIAYKVTQAMDKMKAMGLLNNTYASTDAFVDELQKHLKVAKRCDANHIADCWPTDKVMTGDGEEFEVKNAKTGKNLNIKSNTSNNVGLVLADGSSLILTYNQTSSPIDVGDRTTSEFRSLPLGFGQSKDFAYTTSNTASIDFVMDVNGRKGPNSETKDNKYHDIRSFKAARFAKGCAGVDIPGIGCVVNLGSSFDCLAQGTPERAQWDPSFSSTYGSCWGGAKKACADIGMSLPDKVTLLSIYNKKSEYSDLPQAGYFWSSSESMRNAAYRVNFSNGGTYNGLKGGHNVALCLGD